MENANCTREWARFFCAVGLLLGQITGSPLKTDIEGDSEESEEEKIGALTGESAFEEGCGVAVNVGMKKNFFIQSPDFEKNSYGDGLSCRYYLYGTAQCIPNIQCDTVDIRPSENCEKENLRISDGVGGEVVYCGKLAEPTKLFQATKGFRDLFVHFKTGKAAELGSSKGYQGFKCSVTCGRPGKISEVALELRRKPKKVIPNCVCGVQNRNDRIVGGEDVAMNEFPWQAALVLPGTRKPFCGGSLINDKFILTAAHCFFFISAKPNEVHVLLHARLLDFKLNQFGRELGANANIKAALPGTKGSIRGPGWNWTKVTDEDEQTLRLNVTRIINHPLFASTLDFDVCLLEIDPPIQLHLPDSPTPVCLPPLGILSRKYTNEIATVVGWGRGHELAGSNTRLLQKLKVPILNLIQCNLTIPYSLTRRMICAGYFEGKRDACTGDSGGPLIHETRGVYRQIGIVSWGEGCARKNRPGLYARVSEFNQWITYESQEAGAKWCKG